MDRTKSYNNFINKKDFFYELALCEFQGAGFEETSMRTIAQKANVSLGSFYYYYPSKESIIERFYQESFNEVAEALEEIKANNKKFKDAYISLLKYRIESFNKQRGLIISLSRSATDPNSPLSPFVDKPDSLRKKTALLIEDLMNHYKLPVDKKLKPYMPELFWFYMMGIVLFWIFDKSKKQSKTYDLIDNLTPLILRLIRASALPIARPFNTPIVKILKRIWE